MHDDYIVGYSVNLEERDVVIQTYNDNTKQQKKICFSEVSIC